MRIPDVFNKLTIGNLMLQFKRATVQNYKTGALEIANYRISKSAWLQEHEHKHVAAVSKRVEHMTSMSIETAEELQVVNYGIGGHYEPHFDFARVSRCHHSILRAELVRY